MTVTRILLLSLAVVTLQMLDSEAPRAGGPYDRPAADPHQSRSTVIATGGMVATSHPLAAAAGLDILKAGGNAVDAAIATNAMLGLVEPMSCGIGGDLFAIYWDNKTQKLHGLNASGRSPYSLDRDVFTRRGLDQIPSEGVLSWSVPGCVSGWEALLDRFGSRPLADLLAPSIESAENGFPVAEVIAHYWRGAEGQLGRWPDSAATYLDSEGRAPQFGDVFCNPRLAATYRLLAKQGGDAFYRGEIAEKIVNFSDANGGFLKLNDLNDHRCEWVEPACRSDATANTTSCPSWSASVSAG